MSRRITVELTRDQIRVLMDACVAADADAEDLMETEERFPSARRDWQVRQRAFAALHQASRRGV